MNSQQASQKLKSHNIPEAVLKVCTVLSKDGHQALIVGGAVRDVLLDRPVTDWDIASSATPDQVISSFKRTVPTGIKHGTVLVMVGDVGVEVTTFRRDVGHQDSRHPDSVEFLTDLTEDLARRDFTVNAMAFDPIEGNFFDPLNGLEDLQSRRIVTVGDANKRFEEDGLRIIRAVRFAAQLGFKIADKTRDAFLPGRKFLEKVSRERIRAELDKILESPHPDKGLQLLWECGLWPIVFLGCENVQYWVVPEAIEQSVRLMPDVRLAAILRKMHPFLGKKHLWSNLLNGLVVSKEEKKLFTGLVQAEVRELNNFPSRHVTRQLSSHIGWNVVSVAIQILEWPIDRRRKFWDTVRGMPWSCKELKVSAKDLISEKIAVPGVELGVLLEKLFQWVLEDLTRNDMDILLERARISPNSFLPI